MGDIYVEIGPMDASKAPKPYAEKAKAAMKKATEAAIKSASGFTSEKKGNPNGYTLRFKVAEMKVDPKGVSVKLSGEIVRYPKPEMVTTSLTGGANGNGGAPDALIQDCIEGAVDAMIKKALPVMKQQARP